MGRWITPSIVFQAIERGYGKQDTGRVRYFGSVVPDRAECLTHSTLSNTGASRMTQSLVNSDRLRLFVHYLGDG